MWHMDEYKNNLKSYLRKNQVFYKIIKKIINSYNYISLKFFSKSRKSIFEDIYVNNKWGDNESYSGGGSGLIQTNKLRAEFSKILVEYNIKSILDIPCGDFYWMKLINLNGINYIGADIVSEMIKKNIKNHSSENINFKVLDLLEDNLPMTDLILVRDCLVHFSESDIYKALKNITNSKCKYLMTTSYTTKSSNDYFNKNIATGQWRKLILTEAPFNFPPPIRTLSEECTFVGQEDKTLSIWEINSIPLT